MFPTGACRDDGSVESFAPVTAEGGIRSRVGVRSAIGRDCARNEDAVLCGPTWFAIVDGMGGHGDIASRVAVHVLASHPAPRSFAGVAAARWPMPPAPGTALVVTLISRTGVSFVVEMAA